VIKWDARHVMRTQGLPSFPLMCHALTILYSSFASIQLGSCAESELQIIGSLLSTSRRRIDCPIESNPPNSAPSTWGRKRRRTGCDEYRVLRPMPSDPAPQETEGSNASPPDPHRSLMSSEEVTTPDHPVSQKNRLNLNVALDNDGESLDAVPSVSKIASKRVLLDLNVAFEIDAEPVAQVSSASTSSSSPDGTPHQPSNDVGPSFQDSTAKSDVSGQSLRPIEIPSGTGSHGPSANERQDWPRHKFSTVELDEPIEPLSNFNRFPKYGTDAMTIAYFLSPFEEKIRENDQVLRRTLAVGPRHVEDLELIHFRLITPGEKAESVSCIQGSKGRKPVTDLIASFRGLTRWVSFTHMHLLTHYKIQADEQRTRHENLFSWLEAELFEYTDCPPVLGRFPGTTDDYDLTKYRPIQRRLMNYLVHDRSIDYVYHVSLAVVGIWYKTFHGDFWNRHFESDEEYWIFIDSSTRRLRPDKETLQSLEHLKPIFQQEERLGDFQITQLAALIPDDQQAKLDSKWKPDLLDFPTVLEEQILTTAKELYQKYPGPGKATKLICKTLPVALSAGPKDKVTGKYRYAHALRIIKPDDQILPCQSLLQKLSILLRTIRFLHRKFLRHLTIHEQNLKHKNGFSERFLAWFSNQFFTPVDSLPVIGEVKFEFETEPIGNRLAFANKFNFLQTYLIKILFKDLSNLELFQSSASLLGYWYWKENPRFWKDQFGTESQYFKQLAQLLMT
ncbi:hypothetical protein PSHT_07541, partial [Puccinia striiformis]